MAQLNDAMYSEPTYPVLFLPRKCTSLETDLQNVFIDLNITCTGTDGNYMSLYSGTCNVKLVDNSYVPLDPITFTDILDFPLYNIELPVVNCEKPGDSEGVWIDPDRSPNVYNQYDNMGSHKSYSIHRQTRTSKVTVESHSTYITENEVNYEESIRYSRAENFGHRKFAKVQAIDYQTNEDAKDNIYENDEFECGVVLSQLPEEILNEQENKVREEMRYFQNASPNDALKQLMSPKIQSSSKQRKTILFLGEDGQTIQNISDPAWECNGSQEDCKIFYASTRSNRKKYQCDKCKQVFERLSDFKQHGIQSSAKIDAAPTDGTKYKCNDCSKTLKDKIRYEAHCRGHGDPDLECDKCHKVFASKFTLRTHRKIHFRAYPCEFCPKSFSTKSEQKMHAKTHTIFECPKCETYFDSVKELECHEAVDCTDAAYVESLLDELSSERDLILQPSDDDAKCLEDLIEKGGHENTPFAPDEIPNSPDSVIAKVISNELFLSGCNKSKKQKNKVRNCDVCLKHFDRIGDLKRHLIEHVIKSTLAKSPVNGDGTLNITCEVCQQHGFTKIDKYKSHLREHAKLTLYKCTSCDKSFGDSSNFSKHKKVHDGSHPQCDLCKRKFNSKKMLEQHMEYHNNNAPTPCPYCHKTFHFESALNKHVKNKHNKQVGARYKCTFCYRYLRSLREKWDHEWRVHNARKNIVDCLMCGAKFRKYSELKQHCNKAHNMNIPSAKKLMDIEYLS